MRFLFSIFLLVNLTGCFLISSDPYGVPIGSLTSSAEKEELFTLLDTRKNQIQLGQFLFQATLFQRRDSSRTSTRAAATVAFPDGFRMDILTPAGSYPTQIFVSQNGESHYRDLISGATKSASADGTLLGELFGVEIQERVLAEMLFGSVPASLWNREVGETCQWYTLAESFQALCSDESWFFDIERSTGVLRYAEYRSFFGKKSAFQVFFGGYEERSNGLTSPGRIEVQVPRYGLRGVLEMVSVKVNGRVREGVFDLG